MRSERLSLPMVTLRGMTILPNMVVHFDVSRPASIAAIQESMIQDQKLFVITQRDGRMEQPDLEDLYEVGTIGTIKQMITLPNQILRVLFSGEQRGRIHAMESSETGYVAEVEALEEVVIPKEAHLEEEAMLRGLQDLFAEYTSVNPKLSKDTIAQVKRIDKLPKLVNEIAASIPLAYTELQEILDELELFQRYDLLVMKLANETNIIKIKDDIQRKVKERVDQHQREYLLREQLKYIREELGEDSTMSDAEEFEKACKELDAPEEVKEKLEKEIKRFKSSLNSPSESAVSRTYIETLLEMPWNKRVEDYTDLEKAQEILEAQHYGMEEVKERILEFLAVRALTQKGESPILCLVGPPGTGKTSIAKSLAEALQKPYVRIALGGVRDEAEIRGHRKTYVGAMPGRIATAIKTAGVKNPVVLLDEIDKVSTDYKGDTFSALLEVLDGEQNIRFRDHYLELPLDLSEVVFVTTANTTQTIPRPLLDRMDVVEVNSYTQNEKLHIAMEHLLPKQMERHGMNEEQLQIRKQAIEQMISKYTKEAGVRQLEREIRKVCRKVAKEILTKQEEGVVITARNLSHYLGQERFDYQLVNEEPEVGIVRGLAWTSVGGDTLQIEVNVMPGKGEILLTGQLGDVMKESAQTGLSYIRSISEQYDISKDFFETHDIHVHIPDGAVPKDGPSAGITMATAMLSAITKIPARADIAMTGEITLRGRVLPIGGLKEKLLAAKNAKMNVVLIPKKNEVDLQKFSAEITKGLEIVPVERMDEVLKRTLIGERYGN